MNRRREHWIGRNNHKRMTVGILVLILTLSLPGTTIPARAAELEAEDSAWSFTGDDGTDPESKQCEGDSDTASVTGQELGGDIEPETSVDDSYFTYEAVSVVYGDPVPENPLVLSDAISKEAEDRIFFGSDCENVASVDPVSGAVSVHHAGSAQITAYERTEADAPDSEVRAEIGESAESSIPVDSSGDQIEEEGDVQTAEDARVLASYVLTVDKCPLSVQFDVEKTVGEPDPDLETRIQEAIAGQLVESEEETETTLSRLCGEISYEYSYEGDLTPPGLLREARKSMITLFFEPDADYVFESMEGDYLEDGLLRERTLVLTTRATEPTVDPSPEITPVPGETPEWPEPVPDPDPQYPSEGGGTFVPDPSGEQNPQENPAHGGAEPSPAASEKGDDTTLESEKVLHETVISGVEDQRSYTGAVTPMIQLAGSGYDSYQIHVTRESLGEAADVTAEVLGSDSVEGRVPQGADAVIYGSNLEPTPENDGVYTLSVQYQDAHGNEVEKKITYTVNRFGSVYVYQPYVKSLAGAWVQKIKHPLLITEYNPDPIQENSLHIAITRDGEPIDHVLYSVSQGMQQTEDERHKGWYRYDYAIARENFREDGHYRIVISSKDTAGNQPENANDPTGEISFQVDATPPEIQELTGLEKPYTDQAIQPVTYRIYDSMQLASVRVYVNDAVAQEVTEFEDPNYFRGELTLREGKRQRIYLEVTDQAGNQTVSQTYEICWHRGWLWCLGFVLLLMATGAAFCICLWRRNPKKNTSAA